MKKLSEKYNHIDTGITFELKYSTSIVNGVKSSNTVVIKPSENAIFRSQGFVFSNSTPETVIKIGKALLEIGKFVEKL